METNSNSATAALNNTAAGISASAPASEVLAQDSGDTLFASDALKREIALQPVVGRFKKSAKGSWGLFITFTENRKQGMGDVWLRCSKKLVDQGLLAQQGENMVFAPATLGISGGEFKLI